MDIATILSKHSAIGVVGNRSTAKTSLVLTQLLQLRKDYPRLKIAVMGINKELHDMLQSHHITIIESKMDLLDLRLKDTVIFVDEVATIFDTRNKNKSLDKLERFFDRLDHLNDKIILGTAREGYWNKFMCSRLTAFLVKQTEYDSLVNGSWLKERIKAINSISDYRLVAEKNEYYVVTAGENITTKETFSYNPELDTKKENKNLFEKPVPKKKHS